jgi:arylesterase/paraoxonase
MRIFKKIFLLLVILLAIFIGHTLVSTGFFRTIETKFDGVILQKTALKGAEDMIMSYEDSFLLISATNRMIYPPTVEEKGGLFLIDVTSEDFKPISLSKSFKKSFAPHGISMIKKDSSYQIMAINHTLKKHSIEVFDLYKTKLTHIKTLEHSSMISPNDLVMIDENRFYFTNDHGYVEGISKFIEEYGGLSVSNVVYSDGKEYKEVADGIAYANGINYDFKRNLLFVASPRGFLVKVYSKKEDGSLTFIEDIPCGTGVDNIEFDKEGNLWIGAHPDLITFGEYAKGNKEISPSEIIKIKYKTQGDYSIESVYLEDGKEMSASTVATTFGNLIFVGNVMDDEFLVLKRNKK